jgi:hypothetical protein
MAVVGLTILLAWGVPALAAAPDAGSFSGGTSQPDGAVKFTVPAGGGEVLDLEATLVATCEKAGAPTQTWEVSLTPAPTIPIAAGEFAFSGGFSLYVESKPLGHGTGEVRGSFTSDRAVAGSMRFPWNISAGPLDGYHCDTGVVTFQARAPMPETAAPAPLPGSGECVVPALKGKKLKAAKRAVRSSGCDVGMILHRRSGRIASGRVIGQRPRPGARRGAEAPIKVIVSSGSPRQR